MAKNNNKGFSLIEIIIAIAILSVLLIPIINQFAGTMRTNRRSKEQQKANENAQYVLEYFKNASLTELRSTSGSGNIHTTTYTPIEMKDADACEIYVASKDASGVYTIDSSPIGKVPYNVMKFTLNDEYIGSKRTKYNRTVYLDDLTAQLKATEFTVGSETNTYRIAYDLPEGLTTPDVVSDDLAAGFTRTNEGSYVLYDSANEYIRGIVCVKSSNDVIDNPNEIDAGNVHSLNSEGVALITGFATDFDKQASAELYARAMETLRNEHPDEWMIEMGKTDEDALSYIDDFGYLDGLKKLLVVSVSEKEDTSSTKYPNYYDVTVDVIYETGYLDAHEQVTYNAYSQKFYYDPADPDAKVPYIYLEYQPLSTEYTSGQGVEYAAQDYILLDNQTAQDIKMYLIKPKWDAAHRYLSGADSTAKFSDEDYLLTYATPSEIDKIKNGSADEVKAVRDAIDIRRKTYYRNNEKDDLAYATNTEKVQIFMNYTSTSGQIDVYTNMDSSDVNTAGAQFQCADISVYSDYFKQGTARSVKEYDISTFKDMADEENKADRFYTISVHLTPAEDSINKIVLNGAKGEY
ncbi:MAG: prepilin-type N-terminal cleavage/methylation domain-containing protein [Lachnospiraceae bacterium]|nr:prepilin-type N-terminal cleavage/methylation domain-containing protein [Lachnospiraceae bacterium]